MKPNTIKFLILPFNTVRPHTRLGTEPVEGSAIGFDKRSHNGKTLTNKLGLINSLWAAVALSLVSLGAFAADSHMTQSIKHAEAAVKASDAKAITEHAETAKSHVVISEEHLKASVTSLDLAIEHGKQGHADLAKKAAEEAVTHLKAAQ